MEAPFASIGIRPELVSALQQQGIYTPTPVQRAAIPQLLSGRDAVVQAQTGTGKTMAFVLPALQNTVPSKKNVQTLIITPTRELAGQIHAEISKLAAGIGIHALAVYGGQDVEAQAYRLQGYAHLVVGTPGRLIDHLRRGTIALTELQTLVLDEADQMLHLGFLDEVETILRQTPEQRQTLLFSATMPEPVRRLAAAYLRDPLDIRIRSKEVTLETIRQTVVETTDRGRQQALLNLLNMYRPYLAVIFCRTKIRCKKLTEALRGHGLNVDELHGDLTQAQRELAMRRFRDAEIRYLVATDVAARGLDVEGVTHVINYDVPHDAETYIHRIGRTGRAGSRGFAFTFAAPKDQVYLQGIEKGIGAALERKPDSAYRDPQAGKSRKATPAGSIEPLAAYASAEYTPTPHRHASAAVRGSGSSSGTARQTGRTAEPRNRSQGRAAPKGNGGRTFNKNDRGKGRGRR